MARQVKKVATPSKKMLAAKARRKAKAKKGVYDSEKMNLQEAISVLRVRGTSKSTCDVHMNSSFTIIRQLKLHDRIRLMN